MDSALKVGRFQREGGGQAKKTSLWMSGKKRERVSGCKSSPGGFRESWFHSTSTQT